jgi:hypothetical protein
MLVSAFWLAYAIVMLIQGCGSLRVVDVDPV